MMLQKKKSLGQHFLRAGAYVRAVADAAELLPGERVLEIGPGDGALTRELLARGASVVAVEKDRRLMPLLREAFAEAIQSGALRLIEGDILEEADETLAPRPPFKTVANIPYYITGALLKKFLSAPAQPTTLVFLVQKEVAERIARSKKESILSLSVKAYGDVSYVKTVPRGAFSPAPDVDSAILRVSAISRKNFADAAHEARFFALVRAGFAQKRKLLRRNIETVLGDETAARMARAGVPQDARAEDVPLAGWLLLAA